jgi:hypothetical protein
MHQPDADQHGLQIADVERGIVAFEFDIGERPLGAPCSAARESSCSNSASGNRICPSITFGGFVAVSRPALRLGHKRTHTSLRACCWPYGIGPPTRGNTGSLFVASQSAKGRLKPDQTSGSSDALGVSL